MKRYTSEVQLWEGSSPLDPQSPMTPSSVVKTKVPRMSDQPTPLFLFVSPYFMLHCSRYFRYGTHSCTWFDTYFLQKRLFLCKPDSKLRVSRQPIIPFTLSYKGRLLYRIRFPTPLQFYGKFTKFLHLFYCKCVVFPLSTPTFRCVPDP